jgi:hypothetical protein
MKDFFDKSKYKLAEGLEKLSGPVNRAGHAAERAYTLAKATIPIPAIASFLTDTSKKLGNSNRYTVAHVQGMVMNYEDSLKGTPITKKKTTRLLKDSEKSKKELIELNPDQDQRSQRLCAYCVSNRRIANCQRGGPHAYRGFL